MGPIGNPDGAKGSQNMARISLKRIFGKKKEATAVLNSFIQTIETPIAIIDTEDRLLVGTLPDEAVPLEAAQKLPIIFEGETLGWIIGQSDQTEALANLVIYLADKEAEKKTLASEVLDRYREINLLYNLSEKLATTLKLNSVAELAIEETHRLIDGSTGGVMLLDEPTHALETIAKFGDWPHTRLNVGQGIIGIVAEEGKAEIVNDISADIRFDDVKHNLKSLVCAPLKTKQRVIGVIFVGSEETVTYTAADLKLITTLALQTAPAIENALMYEDKLKETRMLAEKNSALEQLDKFKDEFLANTSHELRTPLNGIIGLTESILDGATGNINPEMRHSLSMIVSSGRRLANLVNDILDFSKLKHYDLELDITAVDMKVVTDIVLVLSHPLLNERVVTLNNQISDEIPPVAGDKNRLQQIMHNLVGNAAKFTEKGKITVSAKELNGMVEITVTDTGIGIPDHKLEDIFKSFEQVDASTERKYGGTGLGLSITKQLVELHGGNIRVQSKEGKGSSFTFSLPVSPKALRQLTLNQPNGSQEVAKVRSNNDIQVVTSLRPIREGNSFTILIVDDEAVNRQVLVNQLSLQNYIVLQAVNGPEALDIIRNVKPDLVLLDVMMPKMSGYEVCQKIREQYEATELPVVMLTAKNQVDDLIAGFEAGANDYLPKPFSKNELLARIQTHLRLAKVSTSYARFVPHEILHFLGKESIVDVKLGDQVEGEMTILFTDIRSFTSLTEKMSPKESFDFVNDLQSEVGPIIRKSNGFIDKYIGDAIMAVFPERADDAVQAAIAIRRQLAFHNARRKKRGQVPIEVGIGIHTGKLMLGTIGEAERMEGTVISDAVNTAARIESLTKRYGMNIIISGDTLRRLANPNKYNHRIIDRVKVRGRIQPISLYGIFDGDSPKQINLKQQTLSDFEEGWGYYYAQMFEKAGEAFQRVLSQDPTDKSAQIYLDRLEKLSQDIDLPEHDWEGLVETLTEK